MCGHSTTTVVGVCCEPVETSDVYDQDHQVQRLANGEFFFSFEILADFHKYFLFRFTIAQGPTALLYRGGEALPSLPLFSIFLYGFFQVTEREDSYSPVPMSPRSRTPPPVMPPIHS